MKRTIVLPQEISKIMSETMFLLQGETDPQRREVLSSALFIQVQTFELSIKVPNPAYDDGELE